MGFFNSILSKLGIGKAEAAPAESPAAETPALSVHPQRLPSLLWMSLLSLKSVKNPIHRN